MAGGVGVMGGNGWGSRDTDGRWYDLAEVIVAEHQELRDIWARAGSASKPLSLLPLRSLRVCASDRPPDPDRSA